jgi:hypothetical protein
MSHLEELLGSLLLLRDAFADARRSPGCAFLRPGYSHGGADSSQIG